jgi:putative ABC transport system permease protein
MNLFSQIWAVTALSVRALPQRARMSLVIVIGVASAVAVMISLLAVSAGLMKTIGKNDQPDRVIVLSGGSPAEYMGNFSRAQIDMIGDAPGVKKDPTGKPLVQPQAMVIVELNQQSDGTPQNVLLRGTGDEGRRMNKASLHLIAGRMFRPGLHELIAGRASHNQFKNLDVGDRLILRGTEWTVVGIYEDEGGIDENAIAADADTVLSAFNRNAYQSVAVQLDSPASFGRFRDALKSNPQLDVDVKHLTQYYQDQLKSVTSLFDFVGYFVGTVMAIGAVFGALTTMYLAVDARAREIATLRAIGFGGTAVVVSVLVEALLLAIPGALLGIAIAWLLFNNHAIATGGVSFSLAVTPALVETGIIWALAIGFIGGLAPSIRAARLPVATALRAT